jgi:hypothetical protein
MLKLLLSLTLLVLPSCSKKQPVARPVEPCLIGAKPPELVLDPQTCGDAVCMSVVEVMAIAYYIVLTEERNLDLARCPYIKEKAND